MTSRTDRGSREAADSVGRTDAGRRAAASGIDRRGFLARLGLGLTASAAVAGGFEGFLLHAAPSSNGAERAAARASDSVLVILFQRGGMDGLAAVAPYRDRHLKLLRPNLAIEEVADSGEEKLRDLDGRFGLHPALDPLYSWFQRGELAIVHGAGLTTATRSHFDAQDYMESGEPGHKGATSGWIARALARSANDSPLRAVAIGSTLPRILSGEGQAIAFAGVGGAAADRGRRGGRRGRSRDMDGAHADEATPSMTELYRNADPLFRESAERHDEAMRLLAEVDWRRHHAGADIGYRNDPLAGDLEQAARLIKAGLGAQVVFVECSGWDTHRGQGAGNGAFARAARPFAAAIDAFWRDLGQHRDRVRLLTMTEFGRTVAENGSFGADHGRGSCFFVMGKGLRGGVGGEVPQLEKEALADGRDLPVTTDYRSVAASLLAPLGMLSPDVFPNWRGRPARLFG
jgi:uncharacterized protein (DUF1501 family)